MIASGETPHNILQIIEESEKCDQSKPFHPSVGTYFAPLSKPLANRKWWILNGLASFGEVYIDAGALVALKHKNSLFASGIVRVGGTFNSQQAVKICVIIRAEGMLPRAHCVFIKFI